MAIPTLTPEQYESYKNANKKPIEEFIGKPLVNTSNYITKKFTDFRTNTPGFLDSLTALTIAFWYFFFTGLAVVCRSSLPKDWIALGKTIRRYSNRKMGKDPLELTTQPQKKSSVKIVDLDTHKPLKLSK